VLAAITRKLESLPEARLAGCESDVVDVNDVADFVGEDGRPLWTEEERRERNETL